MAWIRLPAAACAALTVLVSTAAAAQVLPAPAPPVQSPAARLWQLRSGLNVAALACRGDGEQLIVAGYNHLLADHRSELAAAYTVVTKEYRTPAAYDEAMTRVYNTFAQPAAQAALCDHALAVIDAIVARGATPLDGFAPAALATLAGTDAMPTPALQVAVASIPQILHDAPSADASPPAPGTDVPGD